MEGQVCAGRPPGTLPLLDCRSSPSLPFQGDWERLQQASIRHWELGLRYGEGAAPRAGSGAAELFELANELVDRWWPVYASAPETFDLVLKGRRAPSALGGLCLYGLVTAVFLRAQFACEALRDARGALQDVQLALDMLGGRLHLDFMREASRWPFDAMDLRLNRDMLLAWLEERSEGHGDASLQLPVFALAGGRGRPALPVVVVTPSGRRLWSQPRGRAKGAAEEAARPLRLAIFGVHSTLMLEPMTMLRVALFPRPVHFRVFMRDCPTGNAVWGHHCMLQCRALGECRPPEGSKRLFLDLVHMFEDAIFGGSEYHRVADYLELLVQMYRMDEHLQSAALYICTSALVCSLLRAVFEKPLLAYFGMQLHVDIDRQKDQLWLMHFREMARNTCANKFAVHNFAMREQIHYATGVRIDVVRPRTLYVHGDLAPWRLARVHEGHVRAPLWNDRVLLYRSSYFQLSLFLPVFEAALAECGDYPLAVRVVRNASDFVEFPELRRYRAVAIFPWDPALMAFYELYSLAGPAVFLPDRSWVFKIQQLTGWIWSQPSGAVELAGLRALGGAEAAKGRESHEVAPWWRPEESLPEQTLHWYAYSDFERLPHLLRFSSLAQLLRRLLRGPALRAARRGMRRHNRRTLRAGLGWYRNTLARLLAGGGCGPGRGGS